MRPALARSRAEADARFGRLKRRRDAEATIDEWG